MNMHLKSAATMLGALALGTGAVVAASAPASATTLPPDCQATITTVSCFYTSGTNSFTVPSGISALHVIAFGGWGAADADGQGVGGRGALVRGDIAVVPGSTLYAVVGTNGVDGGVNGGAAPGDACAGSGGGASDLRTAAQDLSSRLLVAGGGGGAGCRDSVGRAYPGGDADLPGSPTASGGWAGQGGSAGVPDGDGAGGAGGQSTIAIGGNGAAGALGLGGSGGFGAAGGGGGGGGYYGGGGGGGGVAGFPPGSGFGGGGGGGGGSSYVDPVRVANTFEGLTSSAAPKVVIAYEIPRGDAVVAPTSLTFAPSAVGSAGETQTVTLTASGGPVQVSWAVITGADADQFATISNTCTDIALADGSSCAVQVRFDPTAVGTKTATLVFGSDASNGTQSVPLSGTADPRDGQLDLRGPGTVYTDGDGHTVSLGGAAGNGVSYWLKVRNIGHAPAQFLLSPVFNPRGASGAYANPAHIDMFSGAMGLTAMPAASTYYTPVIPAGGSQTYRMVVTPNSTDPQGISPVDVMLTRLDGALLALGHTQTNVAAGNSGTTSWDIFVANGSQPAVGGSFSGQTMTAPTLTTSSGSSESWSVKLRNDGRTSGPIGLHLQGSCGGFPIKVTAPSGFSGVDVTSQVLAGTYYTPTLAPGSATTLTVKATWDQASSCTSEAFTATTLDTAGNAHVTAYLQANLIAT
jgi:hypothetical protein